MKKRFLFILILFSIILIISCNAPGVKETNVSTPKTEINKTVKETADYPKGKRSQTVEEIPDETLKMICEQEEWPPDCSMIPVAEGVEMCKRCKSMLPEPTKQAHSEKYEQKATPYSKFPSCDDKKELFTVSHIPISELQNIVPLGNLNPPGHTFPTNHLYFHLKGFGVSQSEPIAPIISPADILVTRIRSSEYTMKGRQLKDYKLDFIVCNEVRGYFIHVTSLSDKLLQIFGQPADCNEYDTGGTHYKNCEKDLYLSPISLKTGESIGTVGGSSDFGLADLRTQELIYANPQRWNEDPLHRVCPIDYFIPDVAAQFRSLLGSYDAKRTIEPLCGEVAQDILGTAQGVWFVKETSYTYPEDPHISLVRDNVDPSKGVFSVGNSMGKSGLSSGIYHFTPKSSGLVNRDFKDVKVDGSVYCYETEGRFGGKSSFIILIQLTTPTTLAIEKQNSYSCGTGPWSFSSSYTEFER